jgi:hypothetical protein
MVSLLYILIFSTEILHHCLSIYDDISNEIYVYCLNKIKLNKKKIKWMCFYGYEFWFFQEWFLKSHLYNHWNLLFFLFYTVIYNVLLMKGMRQNLIGTCKFFFVRTTCNLTWRLVTLSWFNDYIEFYWYLFFCQIFLKINRSSYHHIFRNGV